MSEEREPYSIVSRIVNETLEKRQDYIEKMAMAYLALTDIPPQEAVLVEETRDLQTFWYIQRREQVIEERTRHVALTKEERSAKIIDELLVLFDLYESDYQIVQDALGFIAEARRNNPDYPITASLAQYMRDRNLIS